MMGSINDFPPKRIVVVLGMHRSGTSVVARALKVMGVDLGSRLIPGLPDNEKGFWEDEDLFRINEELLRRFSLDWDALMPISCEELEHERLRDLQSRAVALLREKTDGVDVFGIKDPRMARLLRFWKEIFNRCKLVASYVIVVRNPLSVSKSLAVRNKIAEEKACYLWALHVLPSILETAGALRVVVDYDRLMERPEGEIRRMAQALRLDDQVDSEALAEFTDRFLEERLRHTRYGSEVLATTLSVPLQVADIFEELKKIASDELSVEASEARVFFAEASKRFEELYPALRYMNRQDERIVELDKNVTGRDTQIIHFGRSIAERDRRIIELGQRVAQLDWKIAGLEQSKVNLDRLLVERDERIAGLEQGRVKLNQLLVERDERIAGLEQNMVELSRFSSERDKEIDVLKKSLGERDELIHAFREEFQKIYRSLTWIVASRIKPLVPKWMEKLMRGAYDVYKALGLSLSDEQCIQRSGLFDAEWYLAKYPDVAQARIDPLEHYLRWGSFEGRLPSPGFDGKWYQNEHPDILATGVNPLVHYLRHGKKEGHKPVPFTSPCEDLSISAKTPLLQSRFFRKQHEIEAIYSHALEGKDPVVSILIPTYGSLSDVEKCLGSMLGHPPQVAYEVLIINDKPAQKADLSKWVEVRQELLRHFHCRIFSSSQNVGFVRSINALSGRASGEWLFFLNDDTEVCSPKWLDALVDTIQSDKGIGAAGSLLLFPRSNLVNHAGLYPVVREGGMIWNGCFYKYFNKNYPGVNLKREVPMLTGAALFISRKLFVEAGRLDEKYLGAGGFDDSDLCNRLITRGYKLVYVPESVIFHCEGKTNRTVDSHKSQLFENQRYYSRKWSVFLKERYGL